MSIHDLVKAPYPPLTHPDVSMRRPPMFGMAMYQRARKSMRGFDRGLSESDKERQLISQLTALRKIHWPKLTQGQAEYRRELSKWQKKHRRAVEDLEEYNALSHDPVWRNLRFRDGDIYYNGEKLCHEI